MRAISMLLVLGLLPVLVFAAQGRGLKATGKIAKTPYLNGQYRALIIGNDVYKDPERIWKPLKTAVNDAVALAEILRGQYGFNDVRLLKNATRRQMIGALNELAERSEPNDNVIIFYAGHGYLREKTGEGYWIPVDAEGRDDSTFVANEVIKKKVAIIARNARHVLLVSDSCFSGALLREGNRGINLDEKTEAYFRKVARRKSVQILAAGGVEYVDDNYNNTGHSPFSYYFLKELEYNESRLLEVTDLSLAVTRNVAINVQQTPERGVLQGAGHEGGEFFFMKNLPPPKPAARAARNKPAPGATSAAKAPKAALPALAVPAIAPAVAAGAAGGGMAMGVGWGMGVLAVYKFYEAYDLTVQAQESYNDADVNQDPDAYTEGEQQDADAASALRVAQIAAAGAVAAWWFASSSADATAAAGDTQWGLIPQIAMRGGRPHPALSVSRRW